MQIVSFSNIWLVIGLTVLLLTGNPLLAFGSVFLSGNVLYGTVFEPLRNVLVPG